jgi:hypothetical protein
LSRKAQLKTLSNATDKLSKLKHIINESGLIAKKYDWAGSIESVKFKDCT